MFKPRLRKSKHQMGQKLTFKNSAGDELSAKLEMPEDQIPAAYALFAHCFTCNKNLTAVRTISKALNSKGIAVLRFDFTGLGESEGDFADTNFSSNVEDLICAADMLKKDFEAPALLIGHSLGGVAVLFAAGQIESVQAVATIGAPSSPAHVAHLFNADLEELKKNDVAEVTIGGRAFTIKKQFLDDLESQNMEKTVKELRKPILVMHSPQDTTVGIENAGEIYQEAMHPKSFISLDGADHLLSDKADSKYVGCIISEWAERYLT
jgi:putative redox protein